jgi:hypothetical protein
MAKDQDDSPRPRGRPRAEEPLSPITTWVPTAMHDRLIKLANQKDEPLSATIRELLAREIK